MEEDVQGANTRVFLGQMWSEEKEFGYFHPSKDVLEGKNPLSGNIITKQEVVPW